MMTIEIENEQYDVLLMALGMALATAYEHGNKALVKALIVLANTVGKSSPGSVWIPYEVPE